MIRNKRNFEPDNEDNIIEELRTKCILHWNFRSYNELPSELLYFGKNIEEIYLKWNQLNSIPDWIDQLNFLDSLYLHGNNITKLPESFGFLKNLSVLEIQSNNLAELPKTIGHMTNLQILNVQDNKLKILPQEIVQLKALIQLNARGNILSQLPSQISEIRSLQELILDDNELTSLPQDIVYLPNLKYLSLNKNKLLYMPFDKFINRPIILLNHNKHLNYLSNNLGHEMQRPIKDVIDAWHIDVLKGCATVNVDVDKIEYNRVVTVPQYNRIIVLPKRLQNVILDEWDVQVPSLLEIMLRNTYRSYFETDSLRKCLRPDIIEELPLDIQQILYDGPVGTCNVCRIPIFACGVFAVFPQPIFAKGLMGCLLASMLFCSTRCFKIIKTYFNSKPTRPKFVHCKFLK